MDKVKNNQPGHYNFNYEGEWIGEPFVLHKKLYNLWRGYNSKLLSFIAIFNEYTTLFEFVGVQQLILNGPSRDIMKVNEMISIVSKEFFYNKYFCCRKI